MSPSGNGRRRLVADRRTQSQPKRPARSRSGGSGGNRGSGGNKRKRRTTKRKPRQYGGPLGFVARFIRFVFRLIWSLIWRGAVVVGLLVALATGYYYAQLPDVSDLFDARSRGSVTMLDRHGEVFAWRGEQFGGEIDPTNTSLHLVNAVVATEDRRFWRHLGVSRAASPLPFASTCAKGAVPCRVMAVLPSPNRWPNFCAWVLVTIRMNGKPRPTTKPIAAAPRSGGKFRKCRSRWRWSFAIPRRKSCRFT